MKWRSRNRREKPAFQPLRSAYSAFTLLYMSAWLIAALLFANREFVFYFVVMCILIVAVGLVHLRVRLRIVALWGLSFWGLGTHGGGLMPISIILANPW